MLLSFDDVVDVEIVAGSIGFIDLSTSLTVAPLPVLQLLFAQNVIL